MASFSLGTIPFDLLRGLARTSLINGYFTTLSAAFSASTGHDHSGSAGNGKAIVTTATLAAAVDGATLEYATDLHIKDAGITAAKLGTNLKKGYIPLPLASFREIATNDYVNTAGDAGVLSSNTTPTLARVNGATDKATRIAWAASNVDEIVAQFAYPPDLDDAAAVTVNLLARMESTNDTPVIGVSYFEGVGDTNAGGNTAALSDAVAQKTVSITAGNIGAYPNFASIGLVPAAHGTDALWLYAAWIEYTRKT